MLCTRRNPRGLGRPRASVNVPFGHVSLRVCGTPLFLRSQEGDPLFSKSEAVSLPPVATTGLHKGSILCCPCWLRLTAEARNWTGTTEARPIWGRGLATGALKAFLTVDPSRPLHARVAFDNVASCRVLEKCGFRIVATERGFAEARSGEIEEFVLRLEESGSA